jgi:hypothetical protein
LALAEGRATGVKRERERTEEEKEQEEAIKGLFKKPRKWGVGSKTMPAEEDAELEALLSGPLVKTKKEESEPPQIKSEEDQEEAAQSDVVEPAKQEQSPPIKQEVDEEEARDSVAATVESGLGVSPDGADAGAGAGSIPGGPTVMFKKRKPKNIRQK